MASEELMAYMAGQEGNGNNGGGMFGGGGQNLALFLVPIYNSVQCISGVFSMSYEPMQIILTVVANLLTAGVFAVVLTRMFNSERVMFKK